MLFVISDSIADQFLDSKEPDWETIAAINYLAMARGEGNHLIYASKGALELFSKSGLVDESARRVFRRLHSNYPQLGALRDAFSFHIEVVRNEIIAEKRKTKDGTVLVIPARSLAHYETLSRTTLLCENLRDCSLYEWICRAILARKHLRKISLRFEPRGGGGSTIGGEYKSIQDRDRLCLCVLDSDKKHPSDEDGRTAKSVSENDDPGKLFSHYHVLRSREAENLIPDRLFSEVSDHDCVDGVEFLESLEQSHVADARKFIDIKKGLKLRDFRRASIDRTLSQYWEEVVRRLGNPRVRKECEIEPICSSSRECTCVIMPSLGETILLRVLNFVENGITPHKLSECANSTLKDEWEEIGNLVSAWCCGARPMRSV